MTTAVLADQTDLFDLIPVDPVLTVAPKHFTVGEYHPDELDIAARAFSDETNRAANQDHKAWRPYRGWRDSHTETILTGPHPSFGYSAELRCRCNDSRLVAHRVQCFCPGGLVRRIFCGGCERWTSIHESENAAVAAFHDMCWPGWRDLPILDDGGRTTGTGKRTYKLPADYPVEWQTAGAPILTYRSVYGTRSVAGYSPWGGYDIAFLRDSEAVLA